MVAKHVLMKLHVALVLILTNLILIRNVIAKQELGKTVLNAQRILKIAKSKQKLIFVMNVIQTIPKNPQLEMQNLVKKKTTLKLLMMVKHPMLVHQQEVK